MAKFRKKPIEIEAVRWDGTEKTFEEIILPFLADGHENFNHLPNPIGYKNPGIGISNACIDIPTLEGILIASPGDWIIGGVKGEFYPCKPDIFKATYEEVKENVEDRKKETTL